MESRSLGSCGWFVAGGGVTIRPTVVTFTWDKVEGATGYDIVRDGHLVATKEPVTARTVLKTQVKVLDGGHLFEVHAKGTAPDVQRLDMRYEPPA